MLDSIRGAMKGVVIWVFVALLILAFALWQVPALQSFTQSSAIRVGDQGVPSSVILNEFNRAMMNQRIQSEGAFTREDAIAAGLPGQIVQSLATRSLVSQEAQKMGLAMPRSLVKEFLDNDERFQNPRTGEFDLQVLTQILQTYQMSVKTFEEQMRENFLREQLLTSVQGGGFVATPFTDALLLREIERREVSYLTMTEEMAGIPEEPTPEKLRQFYEENPQSFTAPEYRSFTVVSMRESDFKEGLEAPEEELKRLYDIQKDRVYDKPERRTLYQITYDTEAAAQGAVASLNQATPFEAVAEEKGLSLDAVTFTDVTKEDLLDPAVAEAAFDPALGEGGVSAPVKGLFGWTVIQIAAVTAPETQTFEDVREELENAYLEQDTQKRLYDAIDAIEEARDSGADLVAAAEAAGLTAQTFGPVDSFSFAPGGAIINGIDGETLGEAFRLEEGEESEAEEYADKDGYYFVAVNEITPPTLTPFETAEADVEARWRIDERSRRIARAVKQVEDALAAGATIDEAAAPFNAEPVTETVTRQSKTGDFSSTLVTELFRAEKGAAVSGAAATGDEQTVLVVNEIDFNRIAIGPGQEIAFKQYVGAQLDQEYVDAYLTALQDDYNVRIDQEQIDALFTNQQ
ncbi:MAG: SurA N-terminal domain-containing protein [Pseudomonadota bacterium]